RSADVGDSDEEGTYTEEDYGHLLQAQEIVNELLPPILEGIRARSIQKKAWKFVDVDAADGDHGPCAICTAPFQHFHKSVKVHCIDMHPDAFHGVCRECVRNYGPERFVERVAVSEWLDHERMRVEKDQATEMRRVNLIDAIRRHAV